MSDASTMSARLIGEIFVERGLIAREQLEEALALQESTGERLGEVLVGSFGVSRLELASVLAEQWAAVERAPEPTRPSATVQAEATQRGPAAGNDGTGDEVAEIRRPIGEIFVERGFATESELESALEAQRESGDRLGEVLVAQGVMSRLDLASALAEQWSSLQKLRPPDPKVAEPWQETAVRAATDAVPAADQTPADAPAEPAVVPVEGGLRDAVAALELRLAEVAGSVGEGSAAAARAETAALVERLAVVEARFGELVDRSAFVELRELVEALGSRVGVDPRVEGLVGEVEGVGAAVEGLRGELEAVRAGGVDEGAVRGVEASVAGLAERVERLVGRDELEGLSGRLDALAGSLVGRDELEGLRAEVASVAAGLPGVEGVLAELEGRVAELRGLVDGAGAVAPGAVEGLERRVVEGLAGAEAARGELLERVEGLSGRLESLAGLAARLEEWQPESSEALEQVRATIAELGSRLDTTVGPERIASVEQRLDGVSGALEGQVAALEHEREALTGLSQRVAELAAVVPVEGGLRDAVAALELRLAEVAGSVGEGSAAAARAETAALVERLAVVEARFGELVDRSAFVELRELVEALGSRVGVDPRVEGLVGEVEGVGAAVEGLRGELEAVRAGGVDEGAVRGVEASVAGLAERVERLVGRDELEGLSGRLDALAGSLVGRDELEGLRAEVASVAAGLPGVEGVLAELEGRVAELRGLVDGAGAVAPGAVEGLERRVVEGLAGAEAARGELLERVEGLSGRLESLAGLAARLEEWQPESSEALEQVRATIAELGSRLDTTVGPERIASVEQVLGVLAQSLEERLEALESIFSRLGDRAELDALAGRLEEIRRELAETPARPDLDRVQSDLEGRLGTVEELLGGFAARFDVSRSEADAAVARLRDELVAHPHLDVLVGELRGSLQEADRRLGEAEGAVGDLSARVGAAEAAPAALRGELEDRIGGVGQALEELGARLGTVESRPALAPEELERRLAEVYATLEAGRGALDEHLRRLVDHDRLTQIEGSLAGRIEGTERRVGDHDGLLEDLRARLAAVEPAPGAVRAELDERLTEVGVGLEQLGARLGAVEAAPVVTRDELEARLTEVGQGLEHLGARLGAAEAAPTAMREELDGRLAPVSQSLADVDRRVAAMESARTMSPEELEARVGAATQELAEWLTVQLAELGGSLATLHGRFAELAASRGDADERLGSLERLSVGSTARLDAVEAALREERDALRADVAGLTDRLDAQLAREEERAGATERALRKGLAGLGERLVASQQEYLETGNALRRSIERLGAAVIEADVRADHPLDPPASGHLAFVPTVEGYRLVPFDGPAPAVGERVEVAELGELVVTRVARSPLPLDGRVCAYLEYR